MIRLLIFLVYFFNLLVQDRWLFLSIFNLLIFVEIVKFYISYQFNFLDAIRLLKFGDNLISEIQLVEGVIV